MKLKGKEYLKHVEDVIHDIKYMDFTSNPYEQIKETIQGLQKLPVVSFPLKVGDIIFRSRRNNEEYYTEISKISCPKPNQVKEFGRANIPNQPRFYASENRPTSYMEFVDDLSMKLEKDDEVSFTIGGWILKKDLILSVIYNPYDTRETKYNEMFGTGFKEFVETTSFDYKDGIFRFFEFIADEFSKPVKDEDDTYVITSAYSNNILSNSIIDGIIYPSVPGGGDGFNIVLKEEVVINKQIELEIVGKDTLEIIEKIDGKCHFRQTSSEESSIVDIKNNRIEWNNKR